MSRFVFSLSVFALCLCLFLPQISLAEISSFDQSQFSLSQFNQSHAPRPGSESSLYGGRGFYLPVYLNNNSRWNHYYPTGLAGDSSDIMFNPACKREPYSGKSCIQIEYKARSARGGHWAAMYWQYPAYNWGYREGGGLDLSGASKLVFWARGETGGEIIDRFAVGGAEGTYKDTAKAGIGPIMLTADWKRYEIDLTGENLSSISSGFSLALSYSRNRNGAVFYLDDVYFV
jgi:hypothetical protein